jgi:hypothetical protein
MLLSATGRLMKRQLPARTIDNLIPPYKNHEYYRDCDQLPFRFQANRFDMVNAWWLIEASTLTMTIPITGKKSTVRAGGILKKYTAKGFTDTLLDPLIDHAATFYASHIWNSIPAVG